MLDYEISSPVVKLESPVKTSVWNHYAFIKFHHLGKLEAKPLKGLTPVDVPFPSIVACI